MNIYKVLARSRAAWHATFYYGHSFCGSKKNLVLKRVQIKVEKFIVVRGLARLLRSETVILEL